MLVRSQVWIRLRSIPFSGESVHARLISAIQDPCDPPLGADNQTWAWERWRQYREGHAELLSGAHELIENGLNSP